MDSSEVDSPGVYLKQGLDVPPVWRTPREKMRAEGPVERWSRGWLMSAGRLAKMQTMLAADDKSGRK